MRTVFNIFIFSFALVFSATANNISDEKINYHVNIWDSQTDLGTNTITALLQDDIGYIWIGTPTGLLRFDGVHFTRFDKSNTPAIKSDHISTLYQDSDQTVWIGTKGGGLVSWKNGKWKSFTTENGLSDNFVRAILSDWQGRIWIGTDYGLNVIGGSRVKIYSKKDGLFDNIITTLSVSIRGELIIGTFRSGVFRMYEGSIDHIGYNDGLLNLSVTRLITDSNGRLWIGTLDGLFYQDINDKQVRLFPGTKDIPVTDIMEVSGSEIWYSSMIRGLVCLSDSCRTIPNLPDEYVRCMLQDKNGTIWAGTDAEGLLQLRESLIRNISPPDNQIVTCAIVDKAGNLWAGTRNSGIFRIIDGRFVSISDERTSISSDRITALFIDKSSGLWVGTRDAGVTLNKHNKTSRFLSSGHITGFLQSDSGAIWIGTTSGLYIKQNNSIKIILENISVNSLVHGMNGEILVATTNGLYRSIDNNFSHSGYKISGRFPDILSIYEDPNGVLWLGTNGSGILVVKNEEQRFITRNEGLPDNHIVSIFKDNKGNIWCGSFNGVFMLPVCDLNKFLGDSLKYIIPKWFNESDGMISKHCQPAQGFIYHQKLYIPTAKGISVFATEIEPSASKSSLVYIENVRTEQDELMIRDGEITLSTGSNLLEIKLTSFDFSAISKLHIRYKLDGYDPDFRYMPPDANRIITYKNLVPGDYHFMVQATSHDSDWDTDYSTLTITIPFPFYKNPYFQFTFYPALIATVFGLIYLRIQRKKKKIRDKYKTVHIKPEKADLTIKKLESLINEEKFYLNPDVTLKDLADKLHIHSNHLSRIINENFKLSYNDFVNKYRITEAEKLLSDPKNINRTILEIMYNCGFYSKSVFNTAFKKFTGQTPSQYRKDKNGNI